jgi:pimeloyl-ACP methyl ester carboxylesterase
MKIVWTFIKYILIPVFAVALLLFLVFFEKDIPRENLKKIYTNESSRFLPLMGMEVHYRDEGNMNDSIPIILLHGMSSSLNTWDSLVILMKGEKRMISMDLPAFGLTGPNPQNIYGTDYYESFLDSFLLKLNIKQCIIAGNSMGGGIAWNYTADHPEKINKLILINSAGFQGKKGKGSLGFTIASMPVINNLLLYITPTFLVRKSLETIFVDQSKITEKLITRFHDLTICEGNRRAALSIFKNRVNQNTDKINKINTPTLIIWGENDELISVDNAYLFQKGIKESKLEILKNTGHTPMEENPEKTAAIVKAFLLY